MSGAIFRAKGLLPRPDDWVEGGGLLVVNGRVERVLRSPAEVRRVATESGFSVTDFEDGLLVPGAICAHAHLELSALVGKLESGTEMLPWIRRVMEERGQLGEQELRAQAAAGARALLASGTTLVGDIDSSGGYALPESRAGIRRVAFRELLDGGSPERTPAAVRGVSAPLPPSETLLEGLSPHAPHTVSLELLRHVAQLAKERRAPVQMHWSETREETEWMCHGRGPFGELLGSSPLQSGLDWIESAGLLSSSLSLVHGNHPEQGEPERLAAAGVALVHCPGSHAFFQRSSFPVEQYRRAGVTLALGTDSLASNESLDLGREMSLFRASAPQVSPEEVWSMATLGGARALGRAGWVGELIPEACADFAVFDLAALDRDAALEALTSARPVAREVWMGGRAVLRESDLPESPPR